MDFSESYGRSQVHWQGNETVRGKGQKGRELAVGGISGLQDKRFWSSVQGLHAVLLRCPAELTDSVPCFMGYLPQFQNSFGAIDSWGSWQIFEFLHDSL